MVGVDVMDDGAAAERPDPVEDDADDVDLRESLAGLSSLATGQMSLPDLLVHVAEYAVAAIPGADGAGVTLLQRQVDAVQYGIGEGPCITAAATGVTVHSGSLGTDAAWPRFGPRVRRLGVHSALSLPLVTPQGVLGAMNVYAHVEDAFDDRAVHMGELFAVPAAIAVQNAQVLSQALILAGQLEAGLKTRAVIDQAVGILISRSGATPEEAFASLTSLSQKENRKLALIVAQVVDDAVRRARARHLKG
jgi:GAF domain-containing protein